MMTIAAAPRPRRPHPRGFALIEVLVSLTLLAVGIVGVLTAVLSALDLQKDTAMRYRAGLILQDKLAEIQLVPYHGEAIRGLSADGQFAWTVLAAPWQGMPESAERNRRDRDSDEAAIDLYEVHVEVSWSAGAATRRLSATELVCVSPREEAEP